MVFQDRLSRFEYVRASYLWKMREAHRAGTVKPSAEQPGVKKLFPAIAQWVRG